MTNGNIKTKLERVPLEWSKLLQEAVKQIESNGYKGKVYPTEIVRLLIHFKPARVQLNNALNEIINGFKGIEEVSPEVQRWMKGKAKNYTMEVTQ